MHYLDLLPFTEKELGVKVRESLTELRVQGDQESKDSLLLAVLHTIKMLTQQMSLKGRGNLENPS